jgi:hypothetical protein
MKKHTSLSWAGKLTVAGLLTGATGIAILVLGAMFLEMPSSGSSRCRFWPF